MSIVLLLLAQVYFANSFPIFLCIGDYQIRQAKGYIQEHLQPSMLYEDEMEFIVELCPTQQDLIRAWFASRHSSYKNYIATVHFNNDDDEYPIKGWYCTCSAGARVIGCCAHITALIWHLSVSRAEITNSQHRLSASRYIQFVQDCIQHYHSDESDDTDSNSTDDSGSDDWFLFMTHLLTLFNKKKLVTVESQRFLIVPRWVFTR